MTTISIDFSKKNGKIKPFHAVNNAPIHGLRGITNMELWKAAHIPYGRLHDTALCSSYGGEWVVDVHRIFRDFDADETDPKNYIFAPTDKLLNTLFEAGTKPYFRLGASIEHRYKYGTFPPKDYEKWARISEHIIRHYTEGWGGGFEMDIEYWEVWNEPDNYNPSGNPCWQGTPEEFADFFCTVLPLLQKKFPHLKIGGPSIAWISSDRDWCQYFFSEMERRGVRPDFISYHCYKNNVEKCIDYVRDANVLLERHGYGDVETHLNEWNFVRGWRGEDYVHSVKSIIGLKGAAYTASMMCALHPEKLDMLMYYDARPGGWCGLFSQPLLEPLKGYYPFLAFGKLLDLGTAVESECRDFIYSLGATNGKDSAVLISYFNQDDGIEPKTVCLNIQNAPAAKEHPQAVRLLLLDEAHNLECVREQTVTASDFSLTLDMPPYTTYLIEIQAI